MRRPGYKALVGISVGKGLTTDETKLKRRQAIAVPNRARAHKVTFNGITDSWKGWAGRLGVGLQTLHARKRRGLPLEEILSADGARPDTRKKFIFDSPPPPPPRKR